MSDNKTRSIVLITGGRHYGDIGTVFDCLVHLNETLPNLLVVHGNARGADTLADHVCAELGIDRVAIPANWKQYQKAAGPIRNQLMLDLFDVDLVLAFPGNTGTQDMKRRAIAKNITVIESEQLLENSHK